MTKISFDLEAEEVEVTRTIRKTGEGRILINREGGGDVEINIGIAKIGGTSDYGGAITLGIAGQEVTWGREGDTIHLGIGGFEVDVEARDCIVTEIKSIYGNIVAQRSYPDPGCKPPDPPLPPSLPLPPPTPTVENEIELPDTDAIGWVPFSETVEFYGDGAQGRRMYASYVVNRSATDIDASRVSFRLPYTSLSSCSRPDIYNEDPITVKGSPLISVMLSMYYNDDRPDVRYRMLVSSRVRGGARVCFYGSAKTIKKFMSDYNSAMQEHIGQWMGLPLVYSTQVRTLYATGFIPLVDTPSRPFLPTGNKPPMKDCCEEVLEYLADFEEAFEIRRLLEEKFPISNSFMAPECDPTGVTEAKTFYEIIQCVIRIMAHGMIFEPGVEIKDADAAKAGDQEFKAKYLNATGWASAIAEALLEVKDDGNVSTNMDIRNAFAVTQTMVGLTDAIYKLEAIIDCLGIEVVPEVQTVDTPFNLQIQIGKGFGEGNERQIDLNTDEATEELLPILLRTKKNKIKTIGIHPRSRSLLEMLENIEANLPGTNTG